MKSYTQITADINKGISKLRESAPEAMTGFGALAKGAMKGGALSELNKELIALESALPSTATAASAFTRKTWSA